VNRFSGEQFALPEAIPALRKKRKTPDETTWLSLSAADPLNLVGILTPGARVPSVAGNRVLYRDGVPVATVIAGKVHFLEELDAAQSWEVEKRLLRRVPATQPEEERQTDGRRSATIATAHQVPSRTTKGMKPMPYEA
jgi:hypothetical protein